MEPTNLDMFLDQDSNGQNDAQPVSHTSQRSMRVSEKIRS